MVVADTMALISTAPLFANKKAEEGQKLYRSACVAE